MLEKDPKKRITAENALKHPYFVGPNKTVKKVPSLEDISFEEEPINRPK